MEHASAALGRIVTGSLHRAPATVAPVLAWPLACGQAVAVRTHALEFREGTLQVEVPDAGWRRELQALAPQYLAILNRCVRQRVNRIEFVVHAKMREPNPHVGPTL
jgi:Dna[CI] antecedent, DciA